MLLVGLALWASDALGHTPVRTGDTNATAPSVQTINDTDPGLQYAGKGWSYQCGRPSSFNDNQNDVHATRTRGNSVAYTFTASRR